MGDNPQKALRAAKSLVHNVCTNEMRIDAYYETRDRLFDAMRTEKLFVQKSKKIKKLIPLNDARIKTLFYGSEGDTEYLRVIYTAAGDGGMIRLYELAKLILSRVLCEACVPEAEKRGFKPETIFLVRREVTRYVEGSLSGALRIFALDEDKAISILEENPNCSGLGSVAGREAVLREIPEDITQLFPLARAMKRHFVLHIGDTNSGKTYQSIEELKRAETGAYLAPLRLLALETQDRMVQAGVVCSLLTGEEEDILEGATHISSTVEMLDMTKHYDIVVIDEAQMIADEDRGYAWTKAILGAVSERIHVCMSENARNIVEKLIASCGDSFEVVKHVRNTPLVFEQREFDFPDDIREHDALIVFSRKNVLSVAAELTMHHISASVIYGALPYSVRKNEVARFMKGETKIVVATDAIGMGMNLPVERIVFLESEKFDGKNRRPLRGPEVKQIAGRAGRKGMYETGYVNALVDKDEIEDALLEEYEPIVKARIQMPERLLSLDMPLTDIIRNWMRVADENLYEKSDSELILKKCTYMENLGGLTKEEMWKFALVPYDERNETLEEIWKLLVRRYLQEVDIEIDLEYNLSGINELNYLEQDYKILDLYFAFARTISYNKDDFRKRIFIRKEEIAAEIMKQLMDVSAEKKICRKCGRILSWNYRYNICNKCYEQEKKMGRLYGNGGHRGGKSHASKRYKNKNQ